MPCDRGPNWFFWSLIWLLGCVFERVNKAEWHKKKPPCSLLSRLPFLQSFTQEQLGVLWRGGEVPGVLRLGWSGRAQGGPQGGQRHPSGTRPSWESGTARGVSAAWHAGEPGGGLFYHNLACRSSEFSVLNDILMGEKGVASAACLGGSCSTARKLPGGKVCQVRRVSFGECTVAEHH